jgi:hypothetical protein
MTSWPFRFTRLSHTGVYSPGPDRLDRMALTDPTEIRSEKAMRLPRVTIKRMLVLVAITSVIFSVLVALQRRSERFRRRAAEYTSAIHSVYFADVNGEDGMVLTATAADYHGDLSLKYKAAANRPWLPLESDPPPPAHIRAFWIAYEAVMKTYPSLALGDYNVMITLDDSEDVTVWAVRFRRRDNRSGLTVFLRDPIEIEGSQRGTAYWPTEPSKQLTEFVPYITASSAQ